MAAFVDNKLIFSEEPRYRIARHVLFWNIYWVYFGFLHAANSFGAPEIMYFNNLPYTLTESFIMMFPQWVIAYPMLYLILPHFFLKRKYIQGIALTLIIYLFSAILTLYMVKNINQQLLQFLMPDRFMKITQRPANTSFFMGIMLVMKGGIMGTTLVMGLKLMKLWYLKEHRNVMLQKENAAAQMQLLTAQIHPHFLFNTLNNIFSQTQTESPKGSRMIMGLSDMLRYILYEGQKPFVPLHQELTMIHDYINLEKIRYGNKLDVHFNIPGDGHDLYIAPLLLLPFIENSFKHGASNILETPWINFTVSLQDTTLIMKLMNGKAPVQEVPGQRRGIGINNVRKRLELLYKNNFELHTHEEDEVFVVDLRVALVRINNNHTANGTTSNSMTESKISYA